MQENDQKSMGPHRPLTDENSGSLAPSATFCSNFARTSVKMHDLSWLRLLSHPLLSD